MAFKLPRISSLASALIPAVLGLWLAPHALAQQAAATKPATSDEMNTYVTMGAINMCTQAALKAPYQTAIESNVAMIVSVVAQKHGGKITGAPADLSREQIANSAAVQTLLRTDAFCAKQIPPEWKKDYDQVLSRIKEQIKNSNEKSN